MSMVEEWSRVRVDDHWAVTYWIAQWPRVEVPADFLAPLLLLGAPNVLSVVMAPVGPAEATREVESARTQDLADDELRNRAGFLATARRRRMSEQTVRREQELADGHGAYRFCGYLTVTGPDLGLLEDRASALELAAGQAHLEVRRCYGRQARTLTYTMPLGRGLT
jgi:hypothetical protein